jgi:hypothetical protein
MAHAAQILCKNIPKIPPLADHSVGTIVLGTIVPIRYLLMYSAARTRPLMSQPLPRQSQRHAEAERLIDLARQLLDRPEEEMVVIYLDHAIEALHMGAEANLEL